MTFTSSGRDFHDAPRVIAPLTYDEIKLVIPEAVFQDVLDGRTQMFQHQTSNCGAAGAVAQSHLTPKERRSIHSSNLGNMAAIPFHVCVWRDQTFSSGSLLLPKCVMIKSTARLTDLSKPGGRSRRCVSCFQTVCADFNMLTSKQDFKVFAVGTKKEILSDGFIFISQEWKCEGEPRMKECAFPFSGSPRRLSFLHLALASLCKCHGKFFMHADAACRAASHRLFRHYRRRRH